MNGRPGAADAATLDALELTAVVARIADLATCAPGRAAAATLAPLPDLEAARAELELVRDAMALLQSDLDISFAGVQRVSDAIARAAKGSAISAAELAHVAQAEMALKAAAAAILAGPQLLEAGVASMSGGERPLRRLARTGVDTSDLVRRIEAALDRDGSVRDEASSELAKIRRQRSALHAEVRETCAALVRNPNTAKLLSEPVVTVRAGRYVVPVRREFAAQFPGVVHDESASGATAYIEPMATVAANNRLRGLESAEAREVARILGELSARVGARFDDLTANASLLARLDSTGARARFGLGAEAAIPGLSSERAIRIVGGRHPLLRHAPVPLDVTLGEEFDVLIISGPNMGGKSVALKTLGLFCLLAYAGIPVPAKAGTHIGWFEHVSCVLGDEQSIAADLSSFSAHLRALGEAQRRAGAKSLVLVDEIGSGTEPGAGAAIAQAFIEALLARGARAAVTTHFTQLKIYAAQAPRVANASMLFDSATYAPTYVLAVGVPGQSLALRLARSLHMDPELIARAEALLGADTANLERAFEGLSRERERLRAQQADLGEELARAKQLEARLRAAMEKLDDDRRSFETKAAEELERAARAVREELLARARRSGDSAKQQARAVPAADETLEKTLEAMRRSLGLVRAGAETEAALPLNQGDPVYVRSFDQRGVVDAVYERDALVTMGKLRAVVPLDDVQVDRSPATQADARQRPSQRAFAGADLNETPSSIDVRGMRVDEALPLVDKALDEASLAGLLELRIIHGKGTGSLGRGINAFLRDHAQVASSERATDRDGGSGVTVVRLK